MLRGIVWQHIGGAVALGGLAHCLIDALDGICQPLPVCGWDFFYEGASLAGIDEGDIAGGNDLRIRRAVGDFPVDLVQALGQIV